jgi:hypothetical protein
MLQNLFRKQFPFLIREHKLFREIGQDANSVRASIDHEVDTAPLPFQVQAA